MCILYCIEYVSMDVLFSVYKTVRSKYCCSLIQNIFCSIQNNAIMSQNELMYICCNLNLFLV